MELEVLKGLLQSPQPMLLGLLGQFLVMPFYAFLMAKVFMLPKALALGLILTCSSPGGGGATSSASSLEGMSPWPSP